MRRELWWQTKANDITPMASKMPSLIIRDPRSWPLDSAGTRKDWVTTVIMMTIMLMSANPLALASYWMLVRSCIVVKKSLAFAMSR